MSIVRINQLFGNKIPKKQRHVIVPDVCHIQSLGSLIQLKNFYYSIDSYYVSKDANYKVWLRFRNKFLKKVKREKGSLTCYFCSQKNLNANFNSPKNLNSKQKATIDHLVPLAKGGKRFCESNLVVSCSYCNNRKADMSEEEFSLK